MRGSVGARRTARWLKAVGKAGSLARGGRRARWASRGRWCKADDKAAYTEFAAVMGRPDAVRAAASVCARNAPALFVPCHRVLRSDGSLGGFAWGLDVKRSLLERESVGVTVLV